MKNTAIIAMIIMSFGIVSCTSSVEQNTESATVNTTIENNEGVDEKMIDDVVGGLLDDTK